MKSNKLLLLVVAALFLGLSTSPALAGHRHHGRHHGCADCAPVADCVPCVPHLVTRTIMVPERYYETESVAVTVCRPEYFDETVTVMRRVPDVRQVRVVHTVMEPRTEMRTVNYPVSIPTWRTVTWQVPVMVPYTEVRQGVRVVPKTVRETVMTTVCRDAGHYECRTYIDCRGCCHTCQVWVPQTVTEQVPVEVCRTEYEEQPYQYPVSLCRTEMRAMQDRVCDVHVEMRTKQVPYTYCVPRQVERIVNETTYRCVPEQKVVRRMAMVPHVEYRQVPVCRTRMVPREITCVTCAPACGGCK
jgi:hypothetical protein